MHRTVNNLTVALIYCLMAASIGGCASGPFASPKDHVAGVTPPSERLESLKQLAGKAGSADAAQKQQICQELVKEIQKEEDPILRAELLRTMAVYGAPAADPVLRASLNDPDADVRVTACVIWGTRRTPEAAQLLGSVLNGDIDKDVRMAAARALGQQRDPAAIAALGTALDDASPAMQHRAVLSLREVTGQDLGNDVDRWRAYVKNGTLKPGDPTLAGRVKSWFW